MAMAPDATSTAANGAGAAAAATSTPITVSRKRGASEAGIEAGTGSPAAPAAALALSPAGAGPGASDASSADGKRRRTGPGSRGVANLTPEQLAKKRANDREAQRAIRERTKNQIESLENRIRELTSQQPYQELQAVLRAKEAVEAENADIKRRLASVIALLQPLLAPQSAEHHAYASPMQASTPVQPPAAPPPVGSVSTPGSGASPASLDPQGPGSWPTAVPSAGPSPQPTTVQAKLQQQRHELTHSLELGTEKLGLEFLLDPALKITRLQTGPDGAQDTPQFHHVPMKHDWSSSATAAPSYPGCGAPAAPSSAQPEPAAQQDAALEAPLVRGLGPAGGPAQPVPDYAIPIKNCAPTCLLDSVLLDFLHERRERAAEGLTAQEVAGPRYPSVSSLLNPARSRYAHPLSKLFTDILGTFPDLKTLPERVAVLYTTFLFMRWRVAPTRENYERLPAFFAPRPLQRTAAHPAWVDLMPFPRMRERLIRDHGGPREMLLDNFFVPVIRTVCVNWPYDEADVLLAVPGPADELLINPVFERHLRDIGNWTLGREFADAFPGLDGTYKLKL